MQNKPFIHSIFVGQPQTITDEQGTWRSSIFRDPVHQPVEVRVGGLVGDKVAQDYHGGEDADLCVHLMDHYRFWNDTEGMSLTAGMVGENLTLDRLTEPEVCAGDIVQIGTALAQVTGPRIPCRNLARRIGRPDWVKRTIRQNRTGFYMRVLTPGVVQPGDPWQLVERLNPQGSIPQINRCLFLERDSEYTALLLTMDGLANWWKEQAQDRLQQQGHWTDELKDEG